MKRNKLVVSGLIIIIVISLLGCSSRENNPNKLLIATPPLGSFPYWIEEAAKEYQKENPDFEIEFANTPDDTMGVRLNYLQQFNAQATEIDIYTVGSPWIGDMADHFIDLEKHYPNDPNDDYLPGLIESNRIDNKLVALPVFIDLSLLYYREDLLEKYGFSQPPTTWSELEMMATKIQQGERAENDQFWGYIWQGDGSESLAMNALEWVVSNQGGKIVDSAGQVSINNSQAKVAIDQAVAWLDNISPPDSIAMDEEMALREWMVGNAAFMRNWTHAYDAAQIDESAVKDKFSFAPLPAGEGEQVSTVVSWDLAVSRYSEKQDLAADFLLYLASYEQQKIRAKESKLLPTMPKLYNDSELQAINPTLKDLKDILVYGIYPPTKEAHPYYSHVMAEFATEVHEILKKQVETEVALRYLEMELEDILAGF